MKKMTTDSKMLELLVCPMTKGTLSFNPKTQELVSYKAKLAYPIRDGVPIMLASEARPLQNNEEITRKK
ncbi:MULTISPECIES: Trm112 family protein [unclassified Bartonella]|uniref:Trm112 family protein n=1 Tax=unclassified Bartonella TaxID=2645622 RepID=UPI0035D0CAF8